jgi:hypothetical protein
VRSQRHGGWTCRFPGSVRRACGTVVAAALLAGCASLAFKVGNDDEPVEPATILGYFRYYLLHSTYGELMRLDANWLGGGNYAVKTAPGPHLVDITMSQVSVMNPLIFGGGRCALILETVSARTYRLSPPPMSVYGRFWLRPELPGIHSKRFAATIRVHASDGGAPDDTYDVPLDCGSGELYCRVLSDCEAQPWNKTGSRPIACTYDASFPVGICTEGPDAEAE